MKTTFRQILGGLERGGKPGCNRVKVSQDVMDDRDTISKLGSHAILRSNPHKNQGSVHTNLQLSQVFPKRLTLDGGQARLELGKKDRKTILTSIS